MLARLDDLLTYAELRNVAIGAFNVPNMEFLRGVILAAEELNVPVIVQHAEIHESKISIDEIGPIMVAFAERAKVPVAVHLDHGFTMKTCVKAIKLGFTSIMYDASTKDYELNVQETKEIVRLAHSVGVQVEAELGEMTSSSQVSKENQGCAISELQSNYFTDVEQSKDFVDRTNIDCLAISFGTVHGKYTKKPNLDIKRVKDIRRKLNNFPLVMHGGSGISSEGYRNVINAGIRKINYYTYMNLSAGKDIKSYILESRATDDIFFDDLSKIAVSSVKDNVKEILKIFNGLE